MANSFVTHARKAAERVHGEGHAVLSDVDHQFVDLPTFSLRRLTAVPAPGA
jgi:hypothetical protein